MRRSRSVARSVHPPSPSASPTIKGIFVNSHIEAVRRERGEEGVRELARRFGRPLDYKATTDVPVRDEVRLIEEALVLLSPTPVPAADRAFEAGRLHYRNFTTTPWAKIIFTVFPRNFKFMMLHAKTVAERVFQGVTVEARDLGPCAVALVMSNNDYPLDHFRGLFQEWMEQFGYRGSVTGLELDPGIFQYTMEWEASR